MLCSANRDWCHIDHDIWKGRHRQGRPRSGWPIQVLHIRPRSPGNRRPLPTMYRSSTNHSKTSYVANSHLWQLRWIPSFRTGCPRKAMQSHRISCWLKYPTIEWYHQIIKFESERINEHDAELANLKQVVKELRIKSQQDTSIINSLTSDMNSLQRYTRSFNVRILGMPEEKDENCVESVERLVTARFVTRFNLWLRHDLWPKVLQFVTSVIQWF